MTNEEAIKHLEFMAKGYQNLLDNDERCLEAVGKGYKGEVETQESLADVYKMQIEVLNVAIKALQEHKTGHWVGGELGYCDCCGHYGCASDIWSGCEEEHCPNCGAKMEKMLQG